jgi:hypothetical protein
MPSRAVRLERLDNIGGVYAERTVPHRKRIKEPIQRRTNPIDHRMEPIGIGWGCGTD